MEGRRGECHILEGMAIVAGVWDAYWRLVARNVAAVQGEGD